ncbi:oxidoreductase [Arenibaculum pallidiluteum]|uniref:oxidoreductase n=1 Tax=Arenibaculum pallidiluteum TaxID=2812559 RepID=UPI001A96933E|nr:oxidoreductase [Arenibaculum pallidiluteum]
MIRIILMMIAIAWSLGPASVIAAESLLSVAVPGRPLADLDLQALDALPQSAIATTTPWHAQARRYTGPLLRDVLGPSVRAGQTVIVTALNDYASEIPVEDALRYGVVLATRIDGQLIPIRDKGPLFVMYPFDGHPELRQELYYARAVWQVARIEVR